MRIENLLRIPEKGRLGLMTHLIAGYPSFEANREMLDIMIAAEVDILEVQMPFSEPIADGPVFLHANQSAIDQGVRLGDTIDFLEEAAQRFPGPVLVMGYYNTVLTLGEMRFLELCNQVGVSGFILPDLPPEYATDFFAEARLQDLAPIILVAPNTSERRMFELARQASGMVYAVARKGVTGRKTELGNDLADYLARCRQYFQVPLGVGFGLSSPEDMQFLKNKAHIAIVGSALMKAYEASGGAGVEVFLDALNSGRNQSNQ